VHVSVVQYVEYLREVKRWLDAEEKAVLIALRKKEDARVRLPSPQSSRTRDPCLPFLPFSLQAET
jgi:hypothetical protein